MNHHDSPGVITLPPLIYLGGLTAGVLLHHWMPLHFMPVAQTGLVGFAFLLVAALIALSAKRAMHAAQTNINPRKPTTSIVTSGPYRFSRNPLYLSLVLILIGSACAADAAWILIMLLPVLAIVQVGVIQREEAYLTRKFGDEYVQYTKRVRRWI